MSNTYDNDDVEIQIFQQENCTVSYILGNDQPVRCSIIGDQPLFYMDFEEEIEDEFDEFLDLEKLEYSIEALRDNVIGKNADHTKLEESKEEITLKEFQEDIEFVSNKKTNFLSKENPETLIETLKNSRLASELISFAHSYGITIGYTREVRTARYEKSASKIYINPDRHLSDQLLLAAHELRRVWQHKNGAHIHPLTFHPDQAVLVNRAQIADLVVNMVRISWELQLTGIKEPWERIEGSPMEDLAHAFARESYLDFRSLNNGMASSAVFENWFLSDRCRHVDKSLIQQMLSDYNGYVFEAQQPSKQITAELIIALGTVPYGKNYLAPYVNTIMEDAIFTEVRDRSNANFLWFIKFERSFRETEQELQTSDDVCNRELYHGSENNKYKRLGDDEETANIISLSCDEKPELFEQRSKRVKSSNGKDSNIIYFEHFEDKEDS